MSQNEDYQQLLTELRRQEETLQFEQFTNETAWQIGQRLVEAGRGKSRGLVVDICRNGQQLFHYALPGTSPDNDEWIRRKNRVVNRFNHSSYFMNIYYLAQNTTFAAKTQLDPQEYAASGGAFPIIIKNVGVIGTITVSGLPQEEDHRLVTGIIQAFLAEAGQNREDN